ncbi:MAG: DHA1 family multidrug resistance protein-like MFS transporter [Candidatus Latescibacterota bacterium]|jgi:DHA1 family multidrug resistance protein-like MFS transporter
MPPASKTFGFMRGNILVLSISGALGMFSRSMAFPFTPLFILSLGGQPTDIGIIFALGPLGGLLVFPIAGYLADHTSRAKLIAFTGYFSSITILLYVFAQSWHWIALARLVQGFSVLQNPASSAIIADSLPPENRGRGMATMMTFSGTLAIFAPYLAGLLLDHYGVDTGVRILYAIMAIAYALGATINLFFIKETTDSKTEDIKLHHLSQNFRQAYTGIPAMLGKFPRTLKALTAIVILGFVANGISSPFWVVYAKNHIGLSSAQWGFVLLVEAALGNLVRIPAGFLSDRYGRTPFIFASLLLCGAFIPLFILADTLAYVMLIRCVIAIAMAFFSPACGALLADTIPRNIRGRVMAAIGRGSVRIGAASGGTGGPGVGFLTILPLALASYAGGYLYEWHVASPFGIVLLITIIALILTVVFVRDPKQAEV